MCLAQQKALFCGALVDLFMDWKYILCYRPCFTTLYGLSCRWVIKATFYCYYHASRWPKVSGAASWPVIVNSKRIITAFCDFVYNYMLWVAVRVPALLPDFQAKTELREPPAHQTQDRRSSALSCVRQRRLLVLLDIQPAQEDVLQIDACS